MADKRLRLPTRQISQLPMVRTAVRGQRRLSDKIRAAFHVACDEGAIEIAEQLLGHLDELIHRPPILLIGVERRQPENVAALCERLANLLLWRTEAGWGGSTPPV